MKILIIRHGDPDYANDCLTERGRREAQCLAEELKKQEITSFYISPLGRARETADYTLRAMGREGTTCPWLREFAPQIRRPDRERLSVAWDWLPEDWTKEEAFFTYDHWFEHKAMEEGKVKQEYDWVTEGLDRILAEHGYVREGHMYRAVQPNHEVLAFFCHFGLEGVLLSHLLNISPMLLWHGTCARTTSITTLYTEERRAGAAYFRMAAFGETAHLYVHGEEPSFHARFCECFTDEESRHD